MLVRLLAEFLEALLPLLLPLGLFSSFSGAADAALKKLLTLTRNDTDRVVWDTDHTDLEGMQVTPFSYTRTTGTFSGPTSPTFSGDGSMRQYRDSQALLDGEGVRAATARSGSRYGPTSSGGGSASPGSSSHAHSSSLGGPGFPAAHPHQPLSPKEHDGCASTGRVDLDSRAQLRRVRELSYSTRMAGASLS
jgi:hypothetical protein